MELIRDAELRIVGERYATFSELYRENERRFLNSMCSPRGDGAARALFEADAGVMFTPQDTKQALLYGSTLFDERFERARERATDVLGERYEWMKAPRVDTDVWGQHVIVERYTAGHPESFHRKRPQMRRQRSVNILYDAMCSASTSTQARIEAGCCVLAAAEALEKLGYEVALTFVLAKYSGQPGADDPTLVLEVTMKDYGEPLNSKRMQFALAGKPVLFHLGCWWAHRCPTTPVDYGEGEGYPVSYDRARVKAMEQYAEKRHGSYLSEDIVELRMRMDPVKVLERILGDLDAGDELLAHLRAKTPIAAAAQPEQGKLFGGWDGGGEEAGGVADSEIDDAAEVALSSAPESPGAFQPLGAVDERARGALASGAAAGQLAPGQRGGNVRESAVSADDGTMLPVPAKQPEAAERQQAQATTPGARAQQAAPEMQAQLASGIPQAPAAPHPSAGAQNGGSGTQGETPASPGQAGGYGEGASAGKDSAASCADQLTGAPGSSRDDGADDVSDAGEPTERDAQSGGALESAASGESDPSASDDEVLDISKDDERNDEVDDMENTIPETVQEDMQEERNGEDAFIVALRKRFVRFENGEYLQHMAGEKSARRQAKEAADRAAASGMLVPPAPPTAAQRTTAPMGAPRNTPLSMSYLP